MSTEAKIKRPRIDDSVFVKEWVRVCNEGGTVEEVARQIGCSLPGAVSKWKKLVKDGVDLPELKRKNRKSRSDKEELNSYIKSNLKG